ncbi:MAG: hypothetical protein NW208_02895 [Bryobacter sp.]|nr:hypothetical protein [Bryobacter sp.]
MQDIYLLPQYAYYLRFHLLLTALWFLLVFLSGPGKALAPMLGGIFCLTPKRLAGASAAATLLLFSFVATADLIFRHGPERFGVRGLEMEGETYLFALLPFAAWLVTQLRLLGASGWVRLPYASAGALGAAVVAWVALEAKGTVPTANRIARFFFAWTPEGYFDPASDYQSLYPGHFAAMAVLALSLLLYLSAGFWTGTRIKSKAKQSATAPRDLPICTLVWILALLLLGTWALSGFSFFSDRFPYSVLVNFALLLAVVGFTIGRFVAEPHTYRGWPLKSKTPPPKPGELLRRVPRGKAILVCASGGGIHAGAWAAALLDKLSESVPGFRDHVVLTSTVSGGSVGCYYFLASYGQPQPEVFRLAAASSLDYAAWGYAFGDLLRYFFPIGAVFKWGNRSWAIERAWRRFNDFDTPGDEPLNTWLDRWAEDAAQGRRPAAVFNTTLVETGERFPIATVDLGTAGKTFHKLYPEHTLRAATAANLSAAFPYVTPAARIWTQPGTPGVPPGTAYHIVDGGYYDNYGVLSALEFLEAGFGELGEAAPDVLLLRIEGHQDAPAAPKQKTGFLFQASAPLKTMFTMRSDSQRARNQFDLRLTKARWAAELGRGDILREVKFAYPFANAPLTWHLTEAQQQEILSALNEAETAAGLRQVADFLLT